MSMKKILIKFSLVLITALALYSCKDENVGNGMKPFSDDVKDTATTEQAQMKVSKGDSLKGKDTVYEAIDKTGQAGGAVENKAEQAKDSADNSMKGSNEKM